MKIPGRLEAPGASSPSARNRPSLRASAYPTATVRYPLLILRLAWINFVGPVQDAPRQVERLLVAFRAKEIGRLRAAPADLALHDELVARIQLDVTLRDVAERNQHGSGNPVDLIFVRLPNVDDRQLVAPIQPLLQFDCRD